MRCGKKQVGWKESGAGLRRIFVGGERVTPELVQEVRESFPGAGVEIFYGPTETTIICAHHETWQGKGKAIEGAMLGKPLSNTRVYVLDEEQRAVAVGVVGELYIGGAGVARGYVKREELTAERFVPDGVSGRAGERLYRSGDLARWSREGELEFVGRRDEQVKIRGYRIEPGEVEAALREHEGVRDAVVVAREEKGEGAGGGKRLVAYIVGQAEKAEKEEEEAKPTVTVSELRHFLQERVPEYMVPGVYVWLEELPVSSNGKVDRKRLPEPEGERQELESGYVEAESETERVLVKIWEQVLGVEKVGVHDNFFELGGDSILSIQIVARAQQAGVRVTPRQLFQYPTVAELAGIAEGGREGREGSEGRQGSRGAEAEQGVVSGRVPLTHIQRWFFEQQAGRDVNHFNQAVLLRAERALEKERLSQAVAALVEHHDGLRLRYEEGEQGWEQRNGEGEEGEVYRWVDLRGVEAGERVKALEEDAERQQRSLDIRRGPLVRVVQYELGEEAGQRVLVIVHHLAVDGVSWRILLEGLQRGYEQAESGEEEI